MPLSQNIVTVAGTVQQHQIPTVITKSRVFYSPVNVTSAAAINGPLHTNGSSEIKAGKDLYYSLCSMSVFFTLQ